MEDLYNLWLVKHNILNRIEDDRKEITEIKSAIDGIEADLWHSQKWGKPIYVSDFESTDAWTNNHGGADTTNYISGTQGRYITAAAGKSKDDSLVVNMNLLHKVFRISVYCADVTNVGGASIKFSFYDETFNKYCSLGGVTPTVNGWSHMAIHPNDATYYNGATIADFAHVKKIQIGLTAKSTGEATVTFDRFVAYESILKKGMVAFTFDDAKDNIYTNAKPIFDQYCYPATIFAITGSVDSATFMTLAQLQTLRDQGWAIGSHSNSHTSMNGLTAEALVSTLTTSQNYLLANGFNPYHKYIAYPFGDNNASVVAATRQYYDIGFTTRNKHFPEGAVSRYVIPRLEIKSATHSVAAVKAILDKVSEYKLGVVLLSHNILASGGDYTPAEYAEIIDYVATLDLDVVTAEDLARFYGNSY